MITRRFGTQLRHLFMCQPGPQRQPTVSTWLEAMPGLAMGMADETPADEISALEKAGIDCVWVAEAYSFDAISMMGYLAASTERVEFSFWSRPSGMQSTRVFSRNRWMNDGSRRP